MKAVKKFKGLLVRKRPYMLESILGRDTRIVQPPLSIEGSEGLAHHHKSRSVDTHDRRPIEQALVAEGVHRALDSETFGNSAPYREDSAVVTTPTKRKTHSFDKFSDTIHSSAKRELQADPTVHRSDVDVHPWQIDGGRGHAHNPLEEHLFLAVGPWGNGEPPDPPAVSESPPAADISIYETAYHEEIERIRSNQGKQATIYLTRRVDSKREYQEDEHLVGINEAHSDGDSQSGFAKMVQKIKDKKSSAIDKAVDTWSRDRNDKGGIDDNLVHE